MSIEILRTCKCDRCGFTAPGREFTDEYYGHYPEGWQCGLLTGCGAGDGEEEISYLCPECVEALRRFFSGAMVEPEPWPVRARPGYPTDEEAAHDSDGSDVDELEEARELERGRAERDTRSPADSQTKALLESGRQYLDGIFAAMRAEREDEGELAGELDEGAREQLRALVTTDEPLGERSKPRPVERNGKSLYYCASPHCPGYPYKASEHAHPVTCLFNQPQGFDPDAPESHGERRSG
ncbi:MAG: hypothetical protein JSV86_06275 [Gemmatimonadota bacterium]|nr:MAG: hypothetical protein JSV86_06275 [Gemmatimonadota bacterium]